MRKNRSYNKEFIQDAVSLAKKSDKNHAALAKSLGIPISTLRQWVNNYNQKGEKSFDNLKELSPRDAEFSRLQKELDETRLERDILKKAVAIFSRAQK
jgi:transposase